MRTLVIAIALFMAVGLARGGDITPPPFGDTPPPRHEQVVPPPEGKPPPPVVEVRPAGDQSRPMWRRIGENGLVIFGANAIAGGLSVAVGLLLGAL